MKQKLANWLKKPVDYTLFGFGECEGRMGSSDPYILAINEKQEVYTASCTMEQLGILSNKDSPNHIKKKALCQMSFRKSDSSMGWSIGDYPIQRLLGGEKKPDPQAPLVFSHSDFAAKQLVDAGMGNWGQVLGIYALKLGAS